MMFELQKVKKCVDEPRLDTSDCLDLWSTKHKESFTSEDILSFLPLKQLILKFLFLNLD